ncbi:MAG: hypothetical protein HC906_12425 [Bacteroidales bacterium]|nr:hypothetical protein [Bacteroidales bacterium]
MLTLFSVLCIILSSIGLLGISSMVILSKTKEIGVRKVTGAGITEVLAMINAKFIRYVIISYFLACPLIWYIMNRWLQNFAYHTPLSWWVFAFAGIIAIGIAVITITFQGWKTAVKNPVEALRYE